jgi:hypothetical protein
MRHFKKLFKGSETDYTRTHLIPKPVGQPKPQKIS